MVATSARTARRLLTRMSWTMILRLSRPAGHVRREVDRLLDDRDGERDDQP